MHSPVSRLDSRQPSSVGRPFTGWHMAAIMVAFFGVVMAVNFTMAHLAARSFSGVVVQNSYDASQRYNQWLAQAARERALGLSAQVRRQADGRLAVRLVGGAQGLWASAVLRGEAWHPLGQVADHELRFVAQGDGNFISTAPLAGTRWRLRLELLARDGRAVWHGQELL